jgi:hypothetical protein
VLADRVGFTRDQIGESVNAIDTGGALPGQMVQADVLQRHAIGLDVQESSDLPLEAHGGVAQSDGAMALVEKRLHHDADRVGEVDDPCVLGSAPRGLLGDLHHHWDGAQGLGEAARSSGLLTDAPELEWQGFIHKTCSLPAHPQLNDDEMRSVERAVAISRQHELARPFVSRENAARKPADDFEPLRIDVEEHELINGEALAAHKETFDELRGVGAAPTHHRDFYAHDGAWYAKMVRNG